jgi:hypothetical protein
MSALKTISPEPALRGQRIAHDQARALLGQVMGVVAVTVESDPQPPGASSSIGPLLRPRRPERTIYRAAPAPYRR